MDSRNIEKKMIIIVREFKIFMHNQDFKRTGTYLIHIAEHEK